MNIRLLFFLLSTFLVSDLYSNSDSLLFDSVKYLNNEGAKLFFAGDLDKAEELFSTALILKQKIYLPESISLANAYNNLGVLNMKKWEYDTAIELLEKAKDIYKLNPNPEIAIANVYSNIGNIYRLKGDFNLAEQYYTMAIKLLNEINSKESYIRLAEIYNRYGVLEYERKNYLQSISLYKKAINNYKNQITYNTLHNLYSNLSRSYLLANKPDSVFFYQEKALVLAKSDSTLPQSYIAFSMQKLSEYYSEINKNEEAIKQLDATKLILDSLKIDSIYYFNLNVTYANHHASRKEYSKALRYYQKSITFITKENLENSYDTPKPEKYRNITTSISLLKNKSRCLINWNYSEPEQRKLELAIEALNVATKLIDLARNGYLTIESKLMLAENETQIYEMGLDCSFQLYKQTKRLEYLEKAFYFAEKSKSSVLFSTLQEEKAKSFGNIPDSLLIKETLLNRNITFYKEKIYEENLKYSPDSIKLHIWNNYLFSYSLEHENLKRNFEVQFPEYNRLKYDQNTPTISEIQKLIGRNNTIIEFAMTNSDLFIFQINKNQVSLYRSSIDQSLTKNLNSFLNQFWNFDYMTQTALSYLQFQNIGNSLFIDLFGQIDQNNIKNNLIIIPDNVLSYLPFEVLISKKNKETPKNFKELNYLFKDYKISYSYSSALLNESWSGTTRKLNNSLLSVAPGYPSQEKNIEANRVYRNIYRNNLHPLPYAQKEAQLIKTLTNGTLLIGQDATENKFYENAGKYDILHLAMHTILDDNNPLYSKLVFYANNYSSDEGLLTTNEIFGLNLKARMTVLSSCSSGEGEFKKGEGVFSLARGFFYAGCPSLIMTLWKVDDESGLILMEYYYKNLLRGFSKSKALQKAKLDYLNSVPPDKQHPFYWSTYICIGNPTPLYYPRWIKYGVIACLFFIVISIFGLIHIKSRRKQAIRI